MGLVRGLFDFWIFFHSFPVCCHIVSDGSCQIYVMRCYGYHSILISSLEKRELVMLFSFGLWYVYYVLVRVFSSSLCPWKTVFCLCLFLDIFDNDYCHNFHVFGRVSVVCTVIDEVICCVVISCD